MHVLPFQMGAAQRLQHRDCRPAGEADPDVVDVIMQILFRQHGEHLRPGTDADSIVGVDKPLAAAAVHPGAVGEMLIQRVLDGVQGQRGGHQPGTPGDDRRACRESLFRPLMLTFNRLLAAGILFNQRRH
ncbi:hypothetical protein D3C76_1103420 [compost metagenome]